MARPDPVVGVRTELTDARRRRTYQTHIGVADGDKLKILIAFKKRTNFNLLVAFLLDGFFEFINIFVNDGLSFRRGHGRRHTGEYRFRYIVDTHDKFGVKSGVGFLVGFIRCPKTVAQIVVFERGVRLNFRKAAMVIGQNQALVGDDLCGTKAAEVNDGIFEAALINAVNLLGGELHAHGLHIALVECLQELGQPHSFAGAQTESGKEKAKEGNEKKFIF